MSKLDLAMNFVKLSLQKIEGRGEEKCFGRKEKEVHRVKFG